MGVLFKKPKRSKIEDLQFLIIKNLRSSILLLFGFLKKFQEKLIKIIFKNLKLFVFLNYILNFKR